MVCKIPHWNWTKSLRTSEQITQYAPKYANVTFIVICLFNRNS